MPSAQHRRSFLREHRVATAVAVVTAAVAGTLVALAVTSRGYQSRHVELNDGGIWVTSSPQLGLWGRLNKPAGSLDLAISPPGAAQPSYRLDIRQQGSVVVAWDVGGGELYPVDPAFGKTIDDQKIPVSSGEDVEVDGGTVAVLDPRSDKIWAIRADPGQPVGSLSALDPSVKPLATLPHGSRDAALAVGTDGTVYAADTDGRTATIQPDGTKFGKPRYGKVAKSLQSVQVSAVGSTMVTYDPTAGRLYFGDGTGGAARRATVPADGDGRIQVPDGDSSQVVVATSKTLLAVRTDGDATPQTLFTANAGKPAAPTWLGDCVHAAWAGSPGIYARSCNGDPATPLAVTHGKALMDPVFRVNRNSILLNDLTLGTVYDLSSLQEVDNWSSVKPPPLIRNTNKNKNNQAQAPRDLPPKALDDNLGARPGRTTVLHVLDNDSDPTGAILAVTHLGAVDNPDANVQIAPDGQAIELALPPNDSQSVHFRYIVDDGKGPTASAEVNVSVHQPGQNGAPYPRRNYKQQTFNVSAGGTIELPVLDDWRDPDGDPLVVSKASVEAGTVTASPDGRLDYVAPATGSNQRLVYEISDGTAVPVKHTVPVDVLGPTSDRKAAPVAEPDIARGEVGKPIRVKPLGNDLPGADPADPNAQLALAGNIASPAGVRVDTDLKSGVVTINAARHGSFVLNYTAAYGNARYGHSLIRVDVADPPDSPQPPVAVPDTGVLYGQTAATIDVVANDFDPAGGVLVVTHAQSVLDNGQLQVAIVNGRFLRVQARQATLSPNLQVVKYTITDGLTGPVSGELTLTQQPPPEEDTPLAVDDYITVRSADSALIPVLDNDIDPAGATLSLLDNVSGAPHPGQLAVTAGDDSRAKAFGAAFVSGKQVRYVAPAVKVQTAATISYVARNPAGQRATGLVHVTITPPPTAANPDQAPVAQDLESRVVSGDTIRITVPTTGIDPDGDTANVTGITAAPKLGRIVAIGATSITYEAFPTESGTDRFSYQVTDTYRKTATASVSIGVGQATDPQPPVAVDDVVTAAPGAKVRVDALGNDVIAPDDSVSVGSLRKSNPETTGMKLLHPAGPIQVTAPDGDGRTQTVLYSITDGAGDPSTASIVVRSQRGYVPPPTAVDVPARPAPQAATTTVDVLAKADDPQALALHVSHVFDAQARVARGKITLPVIARAQNIVFQISNSQGGTAAAVIHVPARGVGAPYAKQTKVIAVPRDGSKTIDLADYVVDPAAKAVRLTTTDHFATAPASGLSLSSPDPTHLTLTGQHQYDGPAGIAFQVSDGTSLHDPKAQLSLITLQVQVGPPTPVVRCPSAPISVVEGGDTRRLDVTALCHVWAPDRSQLAALKYKASWAKQPRGVDILGSGSHVVGLRAGGIAKPGDHGQLTVGVPGTAAIASHINVVVLNLGAPSIDPITIDGFKAGTTATRDVTGYVSSPLADPHVMVISVHRISGESARVTTSGSRVSITPGSKTHGQMRFAIVVTDVADRTRKDRQITGTITLQVLNVPDAPTRPQAGQVRLSQTATLSWVTPADNGSQIDGYQVRWPGGSQTCAASPCRITGLHNGSKYYFTVRAHNAVGYSASSVRCNPPAKPDKLPAAVTALRAYDPQDGSLHVSWQPVSNGGSAVRSYQVSWSGGGSATVSAPSHAVVARNLDNHNVYTFTVVARNDSGVGPPNSVQGQSAGNPGTPTNLSVAYADAAGTTTRTVAVRWSAVDPNGAGQPTYTVTRDGTPVCSNTTATSCTDNPASGKTYTYSVVARNQAGHQSGAATTTFKVEGTPDTPAGIKVVPTNNDAELTVSFTSPNPNGQESSVHCTSSASGDCGVWDAGPAGSAQSHTIPGQGNNAQVTITLTDCNSQYCSAPGSGQGHTNGPPGQPSVGCSRGGDTITWNWSGPAEINNHAVHFKLTGATNVNSTTATSYSHQFPKDGNDQKLTVQSVDDRGEVGGSDSATCTDAPKPDPRVVKITMGDHVTASDCTAGCSYIVYQVTGFSPNTTYTIEAKDNPGDYDRHYTFTTNGSGDYGPHQSTGYYGGPHAGGYGTIIGTVAGVSNSCYGNWQKGTGCS